jgi:hypothetical protein
MTPDNPHARVAGLPPQRHEATSVLGLALTSPTLHLAYITNDTHHAIGRFEALGVGPWNTFDMPLKRDDGTLTGSTVRASFARMTGRMFEIVEPMIDLPPIFPRLPGDVPQIEFHHLGAFMDSDADAVVDAATAAGLHCHRRGDSGEAIFVDTQGSLGHWLETLCFAPKNH